MEAGPQIQLAAGEAADSPAIILGLRTRPINLFRFAPGLVCVFSQVTQQFDKAIRLARL